MKTNYITIAIISYLLFLISLPTFAQEIDLNQSSGTIAVQGLDYQPDMNKTWNINTGANKPILFTYSVDLESYNWYDYVIIYNVDDYGNQTVVASFNGQAAGSVSTTIPNGKAKVVFHSEFDSYTYDFTGFTMSFSIDNSMTLSDNIYVSGKVGIGTTAPQEKLHINGYIRGNIGNYGALRVKTSTGYIDIGPQSYSYANFNTDRTRFVFNKPIFSATGEYSSANYGANLSLQTYGTTRMTILNNNGNVGIGTTTPFSKLEVNGEIRSNRNGGNSNIRMVSGSYACMLRNDDVNTYLLFTNNGDANGGWNTLRPLRVSNSTGDISFADEKFQITHSTGTIIAAGKIGIGLSDAASKLAASPADELLTVNGTIHAKEVKVDLTGSLADYVFKPSYRLMPLQEVEQFVKTNSHLPEIPSAAEVQKNGLSIGEMQNKLLQKIEELTLYVIQLEKNNKEIKTQMNAISKK